MSLLLGESSPQLFGATEPCGQALCVTMCCRRTPAANYLWVLPRVRVVAMTDALLEVPPSQSGSLAN